MEKPIKTNEKGVIYHGKYDATPPHPFLADEIVSMLIGIAVCTVIVAFSIWVFKLKS